MADGRGNYMDDDGTLPVKKTGWTPWFSVLRKHKHICCSCSLEHWVEQRVTEDGTVEERWKIDGRATANRRRGKKI